jgi:hypothetical protein
MEMDVAVNKVTMDLKLFGLISEESTEDVKAHLRLLWQVAWEERGRSLGHERKILLFNRDGKQIGEFASQLKAARKVRYSDRAIARALQTGKRTRAGHYWKYAEV